MTEQGSLDSDADAADAATVLDLARVLDPLAYDARAETVTLGQLWEQVSRRMTAECHARRVLAAGWQPPTT